MSSDRTYEIVGRVLGYVVAPAAFSGLVVLSFIRLVATARVWVGAAYLALAVVTFLGNLYLEWFRARRGHGASFFPAVLTLCGLPALLLLLQPALGWWALATIPMLVVLDFVGQPWIGRRLGRLSARPL